MTAALAYDATAEVRMMSDTRDAEDAVGDLAVVWAVVQLAESMPASVNDRLALEEARARLLKLATALGTDEIGLNGVLKRRYASNVDKDGGASKRCLPDASA